MAEIARQRMKRVGARIGEDVTRKRKETFVFACARLGHSIYGAKP